MSDELRRVIILMHQLAHQEHYTDVRLPMMECTRKVCILAQEATK